MFQATLSRLKKIKRIYEGVFLMELQNTENEEIVEIGSRLLKYRRLREERIQKFTSLSMLKQHLPFLGALKEKFTSLSTSFSLRKAELFKAEKESNS
jgi:hypothetical protein